MKVGIDPHGGRNLYCDQIEACGGLDRIGAMQTEDFSREIIEQAEKVILMFPLDGDGMMDDDLQDMSLGAQANQNFSFGQ